MPGLRHSPERHLRDRAPLGADVLEERFVFGWIDVVEAPGQDGDGAGGKRAAVGGCVDPPGQTGNHDNTVAAKVVGQIAGESHADCRRVACTDQGDGLIAEQSEIAGRKENRRRIRDFV